ncbi:hypothetical protein ACRJ4W_37300 [Streptomyces sp. GLT-R25]
MLWPSPASSSGADRRKDQRADAHYVAVRGHDPDDQEGDGQGVIVSNQAKRTIFDVRAHIFADAEGGYTLLDHRIDAYMDPKQTSQSFYDVSVLGDGFLYGITFTDTDGHLWLRDCLNRELIKLPSGRPVLAVGNHLKRRERGSRLRFPRSWPGAKRMWKTS